MITFENKKILITGASSGIGREIAIHLSQLGAKVVLIARDENRLKETLNLMQQPENHKYFSYDLEDIDNIHRLVTNCVEYDNIKFDAFVHCAGVPAVIPLKVLDYKKFEKVLKINTYSYLELIKHLSKKQNSNEESAVVYLSSIMTKYPTSSQISYLMSKASAESISKTISIELLKRKIRINTIIVGAVLTDMVKETEKFRSLKFNTKNMLSNINKTLEPKEVSNMAIFLLSDSAKYIVGENYFIDGGYFS